ncbi:MAG: hypothetical protein Q9191_001618 [Dirinaria sp. TL-2023a]
MRLPYAPSTPTRSSSPSTEAAYKQLSARRAPGPLIPLDLALLTAPPVAAGWSSFFGAIRTQTSLAADIREICICRVAALNDAEYEWEHHAPILKEEGKLGDRAVNEVRAGKPAEVKTSSDSPENGHMSEDVGLDEKQWAVMHYTDAMTQKVKVPDPVFTRLRQWFDEREIVEITATVAAYNCVSRFLVALDVGEISQRHTLPNVEEANGDQEREDSTEIEDAWLRGAAMGIWE